MEQMIQLPPIPASILGISDIAVENVAITSANEFLISVKSTQKEILCRKCGKATSPHGHSPTIKLRHLPVFGKKTYIQITPLRGKCDYCNGSPTTTWSSDLYNQHTRQTKPAQRLTGLKLLRLGC